MVPLLFAAALAASPMVKAAHPGSDTTQACARLATQAAAPDGVTVRKLGDLPDAILEHAVWRMVAGCPVREVVYKGETYYVESANPKLEENLRGSRIARHSITPLGK